MAPPIADPARRVRRPGKPLVTFLARATAAAGGGVLLYTGFAPRTLWWLALPAFGLLGAARARPAPPAPGSGYGALFGLGFFAAAAALDRHLRRPGARGWRSRCAEAVFVGAGRRRDGRGVAAAPGGRCGRPRCGWRVEALRARMPFGGFPWGRVAFGQPDGPLLPLAALGGAPLLSFGHGAGRARRWRDAARAWPVRATVARRRLRRAAGRSCRARRGRRWPRCCRSPGPAARPHGHRRRRAGQRAPPRAWTSTPSAAPCSTTTCGVTEQLAADVAAGRAPQPGRW